MSSPLNTPIGLGSSDAYLSVYIENKPPLPEYENLSSLRPIAPLDIANIAQLTGNHWRKIFNVYAKLLFEINKRNCSSWQVLREEYLLQQHSHENLVFSPLTESDLTLNSMDSPSPIIHMVMGKNYAKKLKVDSLCYWLSEDFAINESKKLIICPYFDYRQLSNIKITQLTQLIKQLSV